MKNKVLFLILLCAAFVLLAAYGNVLEAQCPMCKMSAEANLKNGGTAGRGLNAGILYMLAVPYLLVASIGYWWWRNRRQEPVVRTTFPKDDLARYN
ncbi:MAG TPA: hypothetical protein PK971_12130 [Saprospiraceae bacterium]|nr:hypothetical protein [Saprospiraceae bacterium]HND89074.1 hypothetical protein [Saprospiraceae bacterium]